MRNIQRSQQFIRQSQLLQLAQDQEDQLANVRTRGVNGVKGDVKNEDPNQSTTYARNSKRRSIHAPARLSLPPRNYHEYGDDEQKEFLFDSAANKDQKDAAAEGYIKHKNQKKEFRKSLARLSQQQSQRPASMVSEEEKYVSSVESPEMLEKKELKELKELGANEKGDLKKKDVKDISLVRDGEKSEEEQTRNRSQALAFLEGK